MIKIVGGGKRMTNFFVCETLIAVWSNFSTVREDREREREREKMRESAHARVRRRLEAK